MKEKAIEFIKGLTAKQIIIGIALAAVIIYIIRLNSLMYMVYTIPGLLIAITIHEFAHALIAKKYGDDTAKDRITLNPFKHIDWIGLLSLFICKIGWGKPVEINPDNFKNKDIPVERAEAIVALAGPAANFIMAVILVVIMKVLLGLGIVGLTRNYMLFEMIRIAALMNIGMAVFNLIPIPPLDGYTIIKPFLSKNIKRFVDRNQVYIFIGLILMVYLLPTTIVSGLYNYATNIIQNIGYTIVGL